MYLYKNINHIIISFNIQCVISFSLNPAVDIGQVEGSFIMGLGYCTSEDLIHDPTTGRLLNNDTWVNTINNQPITYCLILIKIALISSIWQEWYIGKTE